MPFDYDLITIGAGSGGVRASRFAAERHARVAIIESGPLGGTCVNVGCIPKKLLSYAAHFHDDFRDAQGFGWHVGETRFDWSKLIAAKDAEILRLNEVYRRVLEKSGVDIVHGRAVLADAHTVLVDGRPLRAQHILIATGSKPVKPPIPGAEWAITSDEAFHLKELPERVVVYGAGYIAVEFASIFCGLGVKTHLVYRSDTLLKSFDTDIACHLADSMQAKGITLCPSTRIERLTKDAEGLVLHLDDGRTLASDVALFATGRVPNTHGLGLEALGVKLHSHGAVEVNQHYQSNVPSIFALGDVIDRVALTPVATSEGMTFADALFGEGRFHTSYTHIPTAVFSHPNVGCVGMTEQSAIAAGHTVTIYKSTFTALRHTLSKNVEKTFMKLVVDAVSERVLGVHMVGPDAGEIIQGFAVALNCNATKSDLDRTIGIHPTIAEEFVTMREPSLA